MRLMKYILIFALAALLSGAGALAQEQAEDLVQRNPLLDAAFSMLEEGNPFLAAYNEIAGAQVESRFACGLLYAEGETFDSLHDSGWPLFSRSPDYTRLKGKRKLAGMDCATFTNWIYQQAGWPRHDTLQAMTNQYGKYGRKNHLYSHRRGMEMLPYAELAGTLQVGDLLVVRAGERHSMMFIGTLRQYGFTAETAPEMADYLDYALVIHCDPNPNTRTRVQQYLTAHADDPEYADITLPDGGAAISIIGVPAGDMPHWVREGTREYRHFELPGGYRITLWDMEQVSTFCWFRIHGV